MDLLKLLPLAIEIVTWLVIASVVLTMIGQVYPGNWTYSPLVWGVIQFGRKLCDPVRGLLERWGVPMRPLDWSPMIVVLLLNILQRLVVQMLFGRH